MLPIGPLMIEHRLIERMVGVIEAASQRIHAGEEADADLILVIGDFMSVYADKTHHGKEESILFRELAKKTISEEHRAAMRKLIAEHVWARERVTELTAASRLVKGGNPGSVGELVRILVQLAEFYPRHIWKEDRDFFVHVMDYFSDAEKEAILSEFREFDRLMIHQKYRGVVAACEGNGPGPQSGQPAQG